MKLLRAKELELMSNSWLEVSRFSIALQEAFYKKYLQAPCTVTFPLGELMNPNLAGHVWVWNLKNCIKPEPITEKHRFNANGLEGCFSIEEQLSTALLMYREVSPERINVFVKNAFNWNLPDNKCINLVERVIQTLTTFQKERNGVRWYSLQDRNNVGHFMVVDGQIIQGAWVNGRYVFDTLADSDTENREAFIQRLTR
jgi:hypothetical protein